MTEIIGAVRSGLFISHNSGPLGMLFCATVDCAHTMPKGSKRAAHLATVVQAKKQKAAAAAAAAAPTPPLRFFGLLHL